MTATDGYFLDATRADLVLGIVGAGVMGRGIAQIAAEAGITVLLADAQRETVDEAIAFVSGLLDRKVVKGVLSSAEADVAKRRLRATNAGPQEGYGAFAPCHVVVEAVAERMDVKHAVLAGLEAVVDAGCIIASNTSSLSVTALASAAQHPERVAGFHFFNPVPLMRLVEVIGGVRTEDGVLMALTALAERMGHHPVRTSDTPGFLVNHAGRAFPTESMRIVGEGIATVHDIDRVMTQAAGFRMGPFQLLDLTGLDVSQTVIESIYRQYYEEPRYRPAYMGAQRKAAGLYGRKVGAGFYTYTDGKPHSVEEPPPPRVPSGVRPVWVSDRHAAAAALLRTVLTASGALVETNTRPSSEALCLVTPFGADATTSAVEEDLDARRVVAVDMLFDLKGRRTIMTTPVTEAAYRDHAHALMAADGSAVTVIHDSPGFIAQRILATVVNIGCDIAQQRIASPDDVNVGVELGLGYPRGPLRLGNALGAERVLDILKAMEAFYGDPRYRPSPWLKRRALLGVPLETPEG